MDPFVCLHLRCPTGSYDVNIEPTKDEVLFTNTRNVLYLLEEFLKAAYGNLPEKAEQKDRHRNVPSDSQNQSFNLQLAKKERHVREASRSGSTEFEGRDAFKNGGGTTHNNSQPESAPYALNGLHESNEDEDHRSAVKASSAASSKPHRNMYEFDEDDLRAAQTPLSPEPTNDVEADNAELRKASVTNPWTLAKLNAPVLSSNRSPSSRVAGTGNEQLMTPGPNKAKDLVCIKQRNHLDQGIYLPSPARSESSHSPPVYQNPGPPLRRRAPNHQGEDEIEFTQESANEQPADVGPSSLDLWTRPVAPQRQLPPSDCTSKILRNDNLVKYQSSSKNKSAEDMQTEIESTQLTDPSEKPTQGLKSPSGIKKPFITPFKTPERPMVPHPPQRLTPTTSPSPNHQSPTRQPWGWSRNEGESTSPVSHAQQPPLSQSHQHPMASPPRLRPSPTQLLEPLKPASHTSNPDLEEIMDFEHRKKAVNAQRKSQTKLTNRYLNPGQLAQIQRESAASFQASECASSSSAALRKPAAPRVNVRDAIEDSICNPTRLLSRVIINPTPPSSHQEPSHNATTQSRSPHQNRYESARAALSQPKSQTLLTRHEPWIGDNNEHEPGNANDGCAESPPHIPPNDPRAYLLQHHTSSSKHRTNSKLKRARTAKLPFETIPPKYALHNLSAKPTASFPRPQTLKSQLRQLAKFDPYSLKGENHFPHWNPHSKDIPIWEDKLTQLIRQKYVSRDDGEEIPATLQIKLMCGAQGVV
jgi:DNA mismatch repair ATPase MutL